MDVRAKFRLQFFKVEETKFKRTFLSLSNFKTFLKNVSENLNNSLVINIKLPLVRPASTLFLNIKYFLVYGAYTRHLLRPRPIGLQSTSVLSNKSVVYGLCRGSSATLERVFSALNSRAYRRFQSDSRVACPPAYGWPLREYCGKLCAKHSLREHKYLLRVLLLLTLFGYLVPVVRPRVLRKTVCQPFIARARGVFCCLEPVLSYVCPGMRHWRHTTLQYSQRFLLFLFIYRFQLLLTKADNIELCANHSLRGHSGVFAAP
ncbi:hypothetical protein BDR26DRAFT_83100 [Obelidium mucronatum]|nr:hypothetical protein BDR26DRAFT_83100 [Obelidium mucronatum]